MSARAMTSVPAAAARADELLETAIAATNEYRLFVAERLKTAEWEQRALDATAAMLDLKDCRRQEVVDRLDTARMRRAGVPG